jgi:hypothetical protein
MSLLPLRAITGSSDLDPCGLWAEVGETEDESAPVRSEHDRQVKNTNRAGNGKHGNGRGPERALVIGMARSLSRSLHLATSPRLEATSVPRHEKSLFPPGPIAQVSAWPTEAQCCPAYQVRQKHLCSAAPSTAFISGDDIPLPQGHVSYLPGIAEQAG